MGKNLSLKFYNGVLRVYVPAVVCSQEEGIPGVYRDVTTSVYPAIAYNEQRLWYESQAESMTQYENLAAMENEQAKQLLAENEQAASGNLAQTTATEVDETKSRETEKDTKKDKTSDPEEKAQKGKKKVKINRKKLEDFDYLRQTFYQIDNMTTIGKDQLCVEKLLRPDMTVDTSVDGPEILIYHTHSQEGYKDSKPGDLSESVVGLGDTLTKLLEDKGFRVLHHKGTYDLPDRDHAYSNAAPEIEKIIKDNPSIQVVIDLHRDGVGESTRLVTEQNGKKMAQIMFFNGLSRTTSIGDIAYLKNPYIEDNLAFSFQMQLAAAEYYPGLTRRIYLKGYRYNMHFCPKSLLVEVGAQTNTLKEAQNSMEPLADLLGKVLQ
ncbi:MAG: stage II sporulation protein P [Lachnobacterium sp.]|nr:stage II sporulation protein P [Lachnobacterium sp.]MDY5460943.1 stage II sporulation protein P [Agathobacter sp.]